MSEPTRTFIALATFNGARFLEAQLASFLAQTRLPDELVVTDDGSTDETVPILKRFAASAPFPVRVHVNEQRLGVTANFERAISKCQGDLIMPADQDDIWRPKKIEVLLQAMDAEPEAGLAFGNLGLIAQDGKPLPGTQWDRLGFRPQSVSAGRNDMFDVLLRFNVINGATMAFRSDLRDVLLPIPPSWVHDEWISIITSAIAPLRIVNQCVADYRQHGAQEVGPAVTGLWQQLRYARQRMDTRYFQRAVERSRVLRDRLMQVEPRLMNPDILARAEARLAHYETRLAMRTVGRHRRMGTAAREWRRGHYRRFGYGWKGLAQDLFLP